MGAETYRIARSRTGMKQGEFGDLLGVSRTTISQRENGQVPIAREAALLAGFMLTYGGIPANVSRVADNIQNPRTDAGAVTTGTMIDPDAYAGV